jgi:MerR family redox-sensitive transcriptional activator SoxR
MPLLTISEVARQVGLQPSAIRYYEQIGIPPAQRISGQRRYDTTVIYRLAVIQRAQLTGFTLDEVQQLFFGFGNVTRASERWQKLSRKKLVELDSLMESIKTMRRLLNKDDAELPLRHPRAMWKGDISKRLPAGRDFAIVPDLDQAKPAVLNRLASAQAARLSASH